MPRSLRAGVSLVVNTEFTAYHLLAGSGADHIFSNTIVPVDGIVVMFAVLFLLRIPAAFTMAIVGFAGVVYVTSLKAALGMIGADMWNIFSSYGLTVIPMFILVGEFAHYGG